MKHLIVILICFSSCLAGTAQVVPGASAQLLRPKPYPGWTLLVPGATHFYDGEIGTGLIFSTLEVAGLMTGIIQDKTLKANTTTPYYNYPLLIGLSAYNVDKCDYFLRHLEVIKYNQPDFQYDDLSFKELMKAPFQPKNFLSPITGVFVAAALAQLYFEGAKASDGIRRVEQMHLINGYSNKNPAMAFYGATSMMVSWGAGVSEEYVFRNYFMPIMDHRYGQKKGLLISSGVFGGMHALNYLIVDSPNPATILTHVLSASVAGFALGKNVQNKGYKIGEAISAHTWYNFTLMLGSFLVNPKENVFGVAVKLKV